MATPTRPARLTRLWHWLREDSAWPFFRVAGSMLFFWGMAAFELVWATWNTVAPPPWRFDHSPTFPVMLLLGNQVQLFYLPILQSAQMMLNRRDDERRQRDVHILETLMALVDAVKSTLTRAFAVVQEIDREADERHVILIRRLDRIERRQAQIAAALGIPEEDDAHAD